METKSLNHLKKHIKLCKQCQSSRNFNSLCKRIRDYANQDYGSQKEELVEPYKINEIHHEEWSRHLGETSDFKVQKAVQELLHKLNPLQQKIIHACFFEEKTNESVAKEMGYASESTIRYYAKKALETLSKLLPSEIKNSKQFQEVAEKLAITPIGEEKGEKT